MDAEMPVKVLEVDRGGRIRLTDKRSALNSLSVHR